MNNDETTYVEGGAVQSSNNSWNDYDPDPFGWDNLPGSEYLPSKRGMSLPSGRSITAPFPGQEESYFKWSESKIAEHQHNIEALDSAYSGFVEGVQSLVPQSQTLTPQQQRLIRQQAMYNINNGMGAVTGAMFGASRGAPLGVPGMVAGGLLGAGAGYLQTQHIQQNIPEIMQDVQQPENIAGAAISLLPQARGTAHISRAAWDAAASFSRQKRENNLSFTKTARNIIEGQASMFGVNKILGGAANPVVQNFGEAAIRERINQIGEYLRVLKSRY